MTFFTNSKKYAKKIKKAEKCVVYENTVRELFSCEQFKKGAEAKGHQVNMVQSLRRLYEKWRYLCIKRWHGWNTRNVSESRCTCTGYSGLFLWNQCPDEDLYWPHLSYLGKKEVYYIISAGLGEDIIERPLGDLDGFVEHLEEYKIAGKIYAANVMDAGLVRNQSVFKKAYDMGYSVQNAEKLRVGE